MKKSNPYWPRKLFRQLLHASPVERADLRDGHIKVWYKTGFKRVYAFRPTKRHLYERRIDRSDAKCEWPINISFQFAWNPLDNSEREYLSRYFHIPKSQASRLSYVERELLIQHLMGEILGQGYIRPHITDSDISNTLLKLKSVENIYHNGMFDFYKWCRYRGRPARAIIERYSNLPNLHRGNERRTLGVAFKTARVLFVALHHLLDKNWDINISTLHSMLYKMKYGPSWLDPVVFFAVVRQIFKSDQLSKMTLVDVSPNLHEKMLTAWLLGWNYSAIGSSPSSEMADRIGTTIKAARKPYDLAIMDNKLKPVDINSAISLIDSSNRALIYVHPSQAKMMQSARKPSRIVRIHTSPIRAKIQPHYLFAYSNGPAKIE